MARKPRFDYPGAVHHVMNRGADHQVTFRNDDDRRLFVAVLAKAVARFEIEILAWCLMGNHYHVVVRSVHGNLSDAWQLVGRSYTQQFNHHHDRDGALFRGRFHSVLVDSDRYLRDLSSYVHNNPVKAGLVSSEQILHYPWSSLRAYAGVDRAPLWLETRSTLSLFDGRLDYLKFVQMGQVDAALELLYEQPYSADVVLGNAAFVERVRNLQTGESSADLRPGVDTVGLAEIDLAVCDVAGVGFDALLNSARGRRNTPRSVAVYIARLVTQCSLERVAEHYNFSKTQTVSSAIGRLVAEPRGAEGRLMALEVLDLLGFDGDGLRER